MYKKKYYTYFLGSTNHVLFDGVVLKLFVDLL